LKYQLRSYSSILEIDPAAWHSLTQNAPFQDYQWHRFCEEIYHQTPHFYVTFEESDGTLVACASLWVYGEQVSLPIASKTIQWAAQKMIRHSPVVACEIPLAQFSSIHLAAGVDPANILPPLTEFTEELARQNRASFVYFNDTVFPTGQNPQVDRLWFPNYVPYEFPPEYYLPIEWPDFSNYLASRSPSTQKDYRRHLNRTKDVQLSVGEISQPIAPILELIQNVNEKHGNPETFWAEAAIKHQHLVNGTWITATLHGRLVGCGLLVGNEGNHRLLLLGMDYEVWGIYFRMMYTAIETAINQGTKRLFAGTGSAQFKSNLGFQPIPSKIYYRPQNPLFRWFVKWIERRDLVN